jgi:hypothetical protein
MMTKNAEELLFEAAKFVDYDQGSPGFLDRFTYIVQADARLASQALSRALAAHARAGRARLTVRPGDLLVETTSSGASLTACAISASDGTLAVSIRLVDAARHPVAGAVIRVSVGGEEHISVTDPSGRVSITTADSTLLILLGTAASDDLIPFPRQPRKDDLALAAAPLSGTVTDPIEPWLWRIEAAGVEFWGLERKGGYDITIMANDITGDAADAEGIYGVSFVTRGRDGCSHRWVVPLTPGPRAFAGSLYGTDEESLEPASVVVVDDTAELATALGGDLDDIVGRSVRHADTGTAWQALHDRLDPSPLRTCVEMALVKRESTP